jgi:hypothetical protein
VAAHDADARTRAIADAESTVAKNRPACAPPFSLITPRQPARNDAGTINGWLDPRVIQHVVRSNFGRIKLCYTAALKNDPALGGTVATKLVITLDGTVSRVEDATKPDGGFPDVTARECVRRVFATLVFPSPDDGVVTVIYPIIFSPGG